jgi:hypothetical protein
MDRPPGRWAAALLLAGWFLFPIGVNPSVYQVSHLLHEGQVVATEDVVLLPDIEKRVAKKPVRRPLPEHLEF